MEDAGWPSVFEVFGGIGVVLAVTWLALDSGTMEEEGEEGGPTVTATQSLQSSQSSSQAHSSSDGELDPQTMEGLPWGRIVRSPPIWVIISCFLVLM